MRTPNSVAMKTQPDATDKSIFHMLSNKHSLKEIARCIGISIQSVARRIDWCRAKRWATYGGASLLSPARREQLLKHETECV